MRANLTTTAGHDQGRKHPQIAGAQAVNDSLAQSASDHWIDHARQWALVGPPLRPGPEDISFVTTGIEQWLSRTGYRDPTLLVLGVTPELCSLPIVGGSRVIAVDNSQAMIQSWWKPRPRCADQVICCDWQNIQIGRASL